MDPSGVIYFFDGNNLIAWKNEKELFRFHTQGKIITSIDVRSGFEILVFYQLQQSIQMFDNRLSELTPVMSLSLPFWVDDIKQGVNNEFWVLSKTQQKLIKLRRNLKISMQLSQPVYADMALISEKNGQLYAYAPYAYFKFANTGALTQEIKQKGISTANITHQGFVAALDSNLVLLNENKVEQQQIISLPVTPEHIHIHSKDVYYLHQGMIHSKTLVVRF